MEQVYCAWQDHPTRVPGTVRGLCVTECVWDIGKHVDREDARLPPSLQVLRHCYLLPHDVQTGLGQSLVEVICWCHVLPHQPKHKAELQVFFSVYRKILLCFACTALGTLA